MCFWIMHRIGLFEIEKPVEVVKEITENIVNSGGYEDIEKLLTQILNRLDFIYSAILVSIAFAVVVLVCYILYRVVDRFTTY